MPIWLELLVVAGISTIPMVSLGFYLGKRHVEQRAIYYGFARMVENGYGNMDFGWLNCPKIRNILPRETVLEDMTEDEMQFCIRKIHEEIHTPVKSAQR